MKRMRVVLLMSLAIWYACATVEAGDVAGVLTWEACVREAIAGNPELAAAGEKITQARADRTIAGSGLFPRVESSLNQIRSDTGPGSAVDRFDYRLGAKQLVFDGLKTPFTVMKEATLVNASELAYELLSAAIRRSLRDAFIDTMRAQELIDITEEIETRRKQNLELVELRYEAGREHKGSFLNTRASVAAAGFDIVEMRRSLEVARKTLARELGRSGVLPERVEGSFSTGDYAGQTPDFEAIADRHPLVRELAALKEAARLEAKAARGDFFPEIYGSAEVGRRHTDFGAGREEWLLGVSVSLPLFEGRRRRAALAKARALLRQREEDERSGRNGVMVELAQAWAQLGNAVDTVGVRKAFLNASEERAKITRSLYSNGLATFDNWTIIEDELARNRKAYLNARAEALKAEAAWLRAKGETLEYDFK